MGHQTYKWEQGHVVAFKSKPSNTLTTKGSTINFIWEILVPENSGNCSVKISKGIHNKDNFELLKPVDSETFSDGSFIFGREKRILKKKFFYLKIMNLMYALYNGNGLHLIAIYILVTIF